MDPETIMLMKALADVEAAVARGETAVAKSVGDALVKAYGSELAARLVLVSKGLITPEALSATGTLTPEEAQHFISLVQDAEGLFGRVTVIQMERLKYTGSLTDIPSRSLRRVAQGSEPGADDKTDPAMFEFALEAEDAQLFVEIARDTIRNYRRRPDMLAQIEAGFGRKIGGEFEDLAWNGDAASADPFLVLNDGWLALAKAGLILPEGKKSHGGAIDPAADGWLATLNAMMALMPEQFQAEAEIFMNRNDIRAYREEFRTIVGATDQERKGEAIQDDRITGSRYMPQGHLLITMPKNLVVGINEDISRDRGWHRTKRVLEIVYDVNVDFGIAHLPSVVYGHPAG